MISQLFNKNNPEKPEETPAANPAETEENPDAVQGETPAEETAGKKKKEKKKKTPKQELMSCILTFLAALAIATLVRAYWVEPVRVDGTSMTNTLQNGEIVLVSKTAYRNAEPQRNDIVICRYPKRVDREINLGAALAVTQYEIFVKRLVALPGDTVEIRAGTLFVNGQAVPDPEFMGSVPMDYPLRYLGEDEYFVIGDNRYSSHDSRGEDVGPLSRSQIMGKVTRVILPWGSRRTVE